jgi:hypothetical protein
MKRFYSGIALAIILIAAGCASEGTTHSYSLTAVPILVSGPLMEGPNTAQYEVKMDWTSIGDEVKGNIKDARLTDAALYKEDGSALQGVSGVVVQLTADDADMEEVAVLNPVPEGSSRIDLQMAAEADAEDYFEGDAFFIVVDVTMTEELWEDLPLLGDFNFEIVSK